MGTTIPAVPDRDTVRNKNAADLRRAWEKFVKNQEGKHGNKTAAPVAKNQRVRAEV